MCDPDYQLETRLASMKEIHSSLANDGTINLEFDVYRPQYSKSAPYYTFRPPSSRPKNPITLSLLEECKRDALECNSTTSSSVSYE